MAQLLQNSLSFIVAKQFKEIGAFNREFKAAFWMFIKPICESLQVTRALLFLKNNKK